MEIEVGPLNPRAGIPSSAHTSSSPHRPSQTMAPMRLLAATNWDAGHGAGRLTRCRQSALAEVVQMGHDAQSVQHRSRHLGDAD